MEGGSIPGHARKRLSRKSESLFCGANGNLACIIFVSASKLRFNGSYSDELRSPQGLEILGDPDGGWFDTGTRTKKTLTEK